MPSDPYTTLGRVRSIVLTPASRVFNRGEAIPEIGLSLFAGLGDPVAPSKVRLAPVGEGSFGGDSEERPHRHLPGLRKNNGRRRAEIDQTDEVNGKGRGTAADNSDGGLPATSIEGSYEDEE